MTVATAIPNGINLRGVADALAPGAFRFDPLGLVSGYKAYLIYTGLAAKSDEELTLLGLHRTELPRVAIEAVEKLRVA